MQTNYGISIREANSGDLPEIMGILDAARAFMRSCGNFSQWTGGYPSEELMRSEISASHCHVCITDNDLMVGTFCFIIGEDPTYGYIEQGDWLSPGPYGTIHRLASSGRVRGVADACFRWCWTRIHNLRADTHGDNAVMRRLLEHSGFVRCGVIYLDDGSPRIAYQKCGSGSDSDF